MTHDMDAQVAKALQQVAPDVDPEAIDRTADLRDECDIDSMDFLNLVTWLSTKLEVPIPESDYPRIRSWESLVAYLSEKRAN